MTTKAAVFSSDPELMQLLGGRLRALRKAQGLTLEQAAQTASLNKSTVVQAEKGRNPTLLTVLRLLRVYGRVGAIAEFIPEPMVSPLALARGRG